MSAHKELLDTTKTPEEAVPRGNLDDEEFEMRVNVWREYLADSVDGPKVEVNQFTNHIEVSGVSTVNGNNFSFSIPLNDDIETAYGISEGCVLERIGFYPKSTGEQIRARYSVSDLPEKKRPDSFAADEKAKNSIIITYEAQTNSKENVCFNSDKFGFDDKLSPRMIPLFVRE